MACAWCRGELGRAVRKDSVFCSKKCRQTAFRFRKRRGAPHPSPGPEASSDGSLRLAYADPPYPGRARKFYKCPEVDHQKLIASLTVSYDGWALSTAADCLRALLPMCPARVRVCSWVKPIGAMPLTRGLHNCWEPLLVCPARYRRPGVRDWIAAQPARHGGTLIGRKPIAFAAWLFELLGAAPGDRFDDLYPGTGIVGRAWGEFCRSGPGRPEVLTPTYPPSDLFLLSTARGY